MEIPNNASDEMKKFFADAKSDLQTGFNLPNYIINHTSNLIIAAYFIGLNEAMTQNLSDLRKQNDFFRDHYGDEEDEEEEEKIEKLFEYSEVPSVFLDAFDE